MSIRWQRVPAELASVALRLQDAEIECRPALEVISRFAVADCLIYADPPYLPFYENAEDVRPGNE